MLRITQSGSTSKTEAYLRGLSKKLDVRSQLEAAGQAGVNALSAATPKDSGETAASWSYQVTGSRGSWTITWTNSHMAGKTPVAIMLQMGHGTGTGGWVEGRDYINPAIKPIMDKIARDVWKAVSSA